MRVVKVSRGDLAVKITTTGEVKPQNRVEVKAPIGGRLEEVLVKEGEEVKKGQILAWMSTTERAALIDAARARGPETLEEWQNIYKPAPVISPIDGTVIVQTLEGGQTVTTTDPVVVLSDRLIIKAQVDETDLSQISLGQQAEIQLDSYPGKTVHGVVDHIYFESTLINNVNVYAVDVLPKETPSMFRSGMTADVTFIVSERKNALHIPSEAVAEWPEKVKRPKNADFAIYKKTLAGTLEAVPVQIGISDGRMTEILEGANEGMQIQIVRKKQQTQGTNPFLMGPRGGQKNEKKS